MRIPKKPFQTYQWRWAAFTPSESLNNPPLFIGVLKVCSKNEGRSFSSSEVYHDLQKVQEDLEPDINLVRSRKRNLFRNSGQYWRSFGLLTAASRGQIQLSEFGRKFAQGGISHTEFATTVVRTLTLPNKNLEDGIQWDSIGLSIKPFELICTILVELSNEYGPQEAYLTPRELGKVIIPLAGDSGTMTEYLESLIAFREQQWDFSSWPDCTPKSNDKRMVREFLLFLSNYGLCRSVEMSNNLDEKYFLSALGKEAVEHLFDLEVDMQDVSKALEVIVDSQIPQYVERERVLREVLNRPNQRRFRNDVLEAYSSTCLISGVTMNSVLEAAHIIPVKDQGIDCISNGICMRSDIHTLFDARKLSISQDGDVILSPEAMMDENYGHLPSKIILPDFISPKFLEWRLTYY